MRGNSRRDDFEVIRPIGEGTFGKVAFSFFFLKTQIIFSTSSVVVSMGGGEYSDNVVGPKWSRVHTNAFHSCICSLCVRRPCDCVSFHDRCCKCVRRTRVPCMR
jgi:hypothetical protein